MCNVLLDAALFSFVWFFFPSIGRTNVREFIFVSFCFVSIWNSHMKIICVSVLSPSVFAYFENHKRKKNFECRTTCVMCIRTKWLTDWLAGIKTWKIHWNNAVRSVLLINFTTVVEKEKKWKKRDLALHGKSQPWWWLVSFIHQRTSSVSFLWLLHFQSLISLFSFPCKWSRQTIQHSRKPHIVLDTFHRVHFSCSPTDLIFREIFAIFLLVPF